MKLPQTLRLLLLCIVMSSLAPVAWAAASVAEENQLTGTDAWKITINPSREIEGYASLTSVAQGGTIDFYITTATENLSYKIEIFRMGYYGGLGGRLMTTINNQTGHVQPSCGPQSGTNLVACNWTNPYHLTIPTDWVSGVYLAKLTTTVHGNQRYIIFVVRDDTRTSPVVFQSSVATYQAYNVWTTACDPNVSLSGCYSLYTDPQAVKVSFNRPYINSHGAGNFFGGEAEYNMVRWLEKEGYDVTYITDVDTHNDVNMLLRHEAYITGGHDEYWSWEMRDHVISARDAGVSLGFFAANTCYWQIRFEDSNRTIVGYKDNATTQDPYMTTDPSRVTTYWRSAPVSRPEAQLEGAMFELYFDGGVQQKGDFHANEPLHWLLKDSGLAAGDPISGLMGYEVDKFSLVDSPAGTVRLNHSTFPSNPASGLPPPVDCDSTVYTAPSGATVFAAGTVYWAWALDPYDVHYNSGPWPTVASPAAQQITKNFLARATRHKPPVARTNGPYYASTGQSVSFNGSASSDADGAIASYAWDFGDNSTGTGVTASHTYSQAGRYIVTLTVTDGQSVISATTTFADIAARLSATISVSSAAQGYPATNANDGNDSTLWSAYVGTPITELHNDAWCQLDFGTAKQIDRLKWHAASGSPSPYPTSGPSEYLIQVSNDAVNWQTVINHPNASNAIVVNGDEPIDKVARYIRMRTSRVSDGTGWSLGFYEFWAEGGSTTNRLTATASASSYDDAYPPVNANDGVPGTLWSAFVGNTITELHNHDWYQLDFGRRKQIDRVKWHSSQSPAPYPTGAPTDFIIQVSDDGVTWETVLNEVNTNTWILDGDRAVGRLARFVRLTTSKVVDGTGWSLGFYEFWAEGSEPPARLQATASAPAGLYENVDPARYAPALANDDVATTQWAAAIGGPSVANPTTNNSSWYQLDFGSTKQIDRLKWQAAMGPPNYAAPPHDYSIEVSDDGQNWITVFTRTDSSSSLACDDPTLVNGVENVDRKARYVRIRTTKVCDGTGWGLSFKEFWAEGK